MATPLPDVAERILARLDALGLGVLDVYEAGKVLPHPYDAAAGVASDIAHAFLNRATVLAAAVTALEKGRTPAHPVAFPDLEHLLETLVDITRAIPGEHPDLAGPARRLLSDFRDDASRYRCYVAAVSEAAVLA